MSDALVESAVEVERLGDKALDILEAEAKPGRVQTRSATSNMQSSHNLKLFWDGQRMAEQMPDLAADIQRKAADSNSELDRMSAELSEQEELAAGIRHRVEPMLQSIDKIGAGGPDASRRRSSARKLQRGAGRPQGRHPLLRFGDQVFSQIMQTRGCTEGLLQLQRMRELLDSVISEVRQINDARGATDVKKLTNIRSSFILLSKEMTLSGGGATTKYAVPDASDMARERMARDSPMPRASEMARVSHAIGLDDGFSAAIYPESTSSRRASSGAGASGRVTPLPGLDSRPKSAASAASTKGGDSSAASAKEAPEEPPRTQSEIEISARVALRKTAAEREGYQHQIAKLKSENRRLEDNAAALADELGATSDALTESRAAGEDVKSENRSLGRQLRASMELAERLQGELARATETEAEKYASEKSERTSQYFEQENTINRLKAERSKMVLKMKGLERKVALAQGGGSDAALMTDGGWDLAVERGKKLSIAESTVITLQSRLRLVEHQLSRVEAARDVQQASLAASAAAEDEVRACIAESKQPLPHPMEADETDENQRIAQLEDLVSQKDAALTALRGRGGGGATEAEASQLRESVRTLQDEEEERKRSVARLQSQLEQLVQQVGERREEVSRLDAQASGVEEEGVVDETS